MRLLRKALKVPAMIFRLCCQAAKWHSKHAWSGKFAVPLFHSRLPRTFCGRLSWARLAQVAENCRLLGGNGRVVAPFADWSGQG
jgi:hypothetical protein